MHLRESVHQIDAHSLTLTNMSNVQDADQLLQRKRRLFGWAISKYGSDENEGEIPMIAKELCAMTER